jgi:hypothetical protein
MTAFAHASPLSKTPKFRLVDEQVLSWEVSLPLHVKAERMHSLNKTKWIRDPTLNKL